MDFTKPFSTVWICVKQCPNSDLLNRFQLHQYAISENGAELCLYYVPCDGYDNAILYPQTSVGPCPVTVVQR